MNQNINLYFVILGLAWGIGISSSYFLLKERNIVLKAPFLFFFGLFFSSWLGGKVFFLINVSPDLRKILFISSKFWLGGGLVFYGGLIFGSLYCKLYSTICSFPFEHYKYFLPPLCFSHALGRIGCFLSGCCYGRPMTWEWVHGLRHPVQIYEFIFLIFIGLILIKKGLKEGGNKYYPFLMYFFFYAGLRFFIEFFRGDLIRGIYFGWASTSQIISMVTIGLCVVIWICAPKWNFAY